MTSSSDNLPTVPDTIERSITIDAPLNRVWELVSRPGWWINDGEIRDHEIAIEGGVASVRDPEHGLFRIEIVELRQPEYAGYRWLAGSNGPEDGAARTLVEFFVSGTDGAVRVRVVESGWAAAPDTDRVRNDYAENEAGWDLELVAAQAFLQTPEPSA